MWLMLLRWLSEPPRPRDLDPSLPGIRGAVHNSLAFLEGTPRGKILRMVPRAAGIAVSIRIRDKLASIEAQAFGSNGVPAPAPYPGPTVARPETPEVPPEAPEGTTPTLDPNRRERIVNWLNVCAAYLRICASNGWDPGLYNLETHSVEERRDIARFVRELGGMDVALDALFAPEDVTVRGWFRVIAGEGDA